MFAKNVWLPHRIVDLRSRNWRNYTGDREHKGNTTAENDDSNDRSNRVWKLFLAAEKPFTFVELKWCRRHQMEIDGAANKNWGTINTTGIYWLIISFNNLHFILYLPTAPFVKVKHFSTLGSTGVGTGLTRLPDRLGVLGLQMTYRQLTYRHKPTDKTRKGCL